uniref:Prothymosin alpha n=1 Tax=Equus asinus asinus TaxID=83772 RepID=A0A8C4LT68_EQUAS
LPSIHLSTVRACSLLSPDPPKLWLSFYSAALDTSSEITTKDLKEKKEVVEEAESGRDAPANGNANEENGEQEAANEEVEEEKEDGEEEDGDEDEQTEAAMGKWAAKDDEDDNVDTKKQKTDEDD